ncbi:MAG: helix-turn-helix domain-containing protein [Betaproteobacteria bacterium]|jgi:excisionase family DNA binding protein|nr:helix-turn-helix domain-containing protein [Betaproteobacteria bacterium]
MNRLLTVPEVCDRISLSPRVVRQMLHDGRLRGSKVAKKWLVDEVDLADLVNESSNRPRKRRSRAAA